MVVACQTAEGPTHASATSPAPRDKTSSARLVGNVDHPLLLGRLVAAVAFDPFCPVVATPSSASLMSARLAAVSNLDTGIPAIAGPGLGV